MNKKSASGDFEDQYLESRVKKGATGFGSLELRMRIENNQIYDIVYTGAAGVLVGALKAIAPEHALVADGAMDAFVAKTRDKAWADPARVFATFGKNKIPDGYFDDRREIVAADDAGLLAMVHHNRVNRHSLETVLEQLAHAIAEFDQANKFADHVTNMEMIDEKYNQAFAKLNIERHGLATASILRLPNGLYGFALRGQGAVHKIGSSRAAHRAGFVVIAAFCVAVYVFWPSAESVVSIFNK